jgi:aryl-alcohol dehydrogenase-like predicted oxidoreductase
MLFMEFRQLGHSGLKVPVLSFGTGTFGGSNDFFRAWGDTDVKEATRLVDICLDAGVNLFDTADVYSAGLSEQILGKAVAGRRDQVLIATKASFPMGAGPNDRGNSRHHLLRACEASLTRLGTDYIDIYQMHGFDTLSPVEETLSTLDTLVKSGKVRYIGCSNFSGWHLMKSLAASDKYGWARYVAHQAYYSLVGRDFEWELMPLGHDQGVGTLVWSPLGWGRLTGKLRRDQPPPAVSRLPKTAAFGPQVADEDLYRVVDALDTVAKDTGRTVPQIALNWLTTRPTVSSVIVGARNEEQLRQNLGAVGWSLTPDHLATLEAASARPLPYPYWHQRQVIDRNPPPT